MAEGERHLAQVMGHVPKYSATIKKHVAETPAKLGGLGKTINAADTVDVTASNAADAVDVTASVDRIVAALLPAGATWQRWASLCDS